MEHETWQDRPRDYLSIHLAIVQVQPGESKEEAWRRHLTRKPYDVRANVKIFNIKHQPR